MPEPVRLDGAEIRVFFGSLAGGASPVRTFTPLLGAQIDLEPRAAVALDVNAGFEHGLLVDSGEIRLGDTVIRTAELGYRAPGARTLRLANDSDAPARAILLGGPPLPPPAPYLTEPPPGGGYISLAAYPPVKTSSAAPGHHGGNATEAGGTCWRAMRREPF